MRRLAYTLTLIVGSALALLLLTPSSAPESPVQPLPSTTPTLPTCTTEDGAGMALCWFVDTHYDGPGDIMGPPMVSGDCSLWMTGDETTQAACLRLHVQPSQRIDGNDGSYSIVPSGADLVQECNDIDNSISQADRMNEQWSLLECYSAWM